MAVSVYFPTLAAMSASTQDSAPATFTFELDDAISLVNQDIAFSDDDWAGFAVELEAYGDPLAPTILPWRIKYTA
jgi:hypothetical protein